MKRIVQTFILFICLCSNADGQPFTTGTTGFLTITQGPTVCDATYEYIIADQAAWNNGNVEIYDNGTELSLAGWTFGAGASSSCWSPCRVQHTSTYPAVTTLYFMLNTATKTVTITTSAPTCSSTPTVTTDAITNITSSSSSCGGNVTSDGGMPVTSRGVCWSTSPNPTIADSKTSNGSGTGAFASSLAGLSQNTTYYVRAYATNAIGTAYGTENSFTTLSQVSGPNYASTINSDASYGVEPWSQPMDAGSDDGVYAFSGPCCTNSTEYLKFTGFGFGIPAGDVIDGIEIEVEWFYPGGSTKIDEVVSLVLAGTVQGSNYAMLNPLPTSEIISNYGSSTDLWGLGLSPADINDMNFGCVIAAQRSGGGATTNVNVDFLRIIVYHHTPVTCSPTYIGVSCFGGNDGAAYSNPNGGLPPISYNWSTGATSQDISGLIAGSYTVTVTDQDSHQDIQTVIVSEPSALAPNQTVYDVQCNGGNDGYIDLATSGGTLPYNFTWAHGPATEDVFSLSVGTYFVTIEDGNSCSIAQNWTVNQPGSPVGISTWVNSNVSCNGGNDGSTGSSAFGGDGGPYTFQWGALTGFQVTPTAVNVVAGSHDITVTDGNSCTETASIVVTEPSALSIVSNGIDETCNSTCDGQASTTVTGGSPGYSFLWSPSTGSQNTQVASSICGGWHYVTATDANSCTITDSWFINSPAGLNGSYTIGGTSPNYNTISDAINDLYCLGVSGAVTFNIRDGIYNEQLDFTGSVPGASAVNTITFQSESGVQPDVSIEYSANVSNNYTVRLNGTSFITIRYITIQALNPTYGHAIQIEGGCSDIYIDSNDIIGVSTTTSGADLAVVFSGNGQDNYITLQYNHIANGSTGLIMQGINGSNLEQGLTVTGNQFIDQYEGGMFFQFLDAPIIDHNTVSTNSNYTTFKGAYLFNVDNSTSVLANQIYASEADGWGFDFTSCDASVSNEALVANNIIQLGVTGASYGLSFQNCTFVDVLHNSVNLTSTSTGSFCFQATGGSGSDINVQNNIFADQGLGQCVRVDSPSPISVMDYNDLFFLGSNVGTWLGTQYATLGAWQAASGYDINSLSADPVFTSGQNLKLNCGSPAAVAQGGFDLSAYITDDYEYETRTNPVSIGADEYNGGTPLNGFYTIGGVSPSYPDFTSAVSDLMCNGVGGAVTLDVRDGIYNEQISIGSIPGISAANDVTFQSESGDSTAVTVTWNSNISDNYTVQFNSASFVTFHQLTIEATNTNYGHVVELEGGSSNCMLTQCVLNGVSTTSTSNDLAVIFSSNTADETSISILDNIIVNGSYGIRLYGTGGLENGNTILGNDIEDFYAGGVVLENQTATEIVENYLWTASANTGTVSMIGLSACNDDISVTENLIFSTSADVEGLSLNTCSANPGQEMHVFNNMIRVEGFGIVVDGTSYAWIYHNSIDVYSATAHGLDIFNGANNVDVQNNAVNASGGGYALYLDGSASGGATSDYNDYYSTGLYAAHWEGTDCADELELNAASGQDNNSVSVDPVFGSTSDLHLSANSPLSLLAGNNLSVIVSSDIDGTARPAIPWMGCDERITFYWVGNAGQWSDFTNHWSTTSGGAPDQGTAPGSADFVIFDTNSFSGPGQLLEVDINGYAKQIDFQDISRTPVIHGSGSLVIGQ